MRAALLLIDLQNDYFDGGRMPLVDAEPAVQAASSLLAAARAGGVPVIHVQHLAARPDAGFFLPGTAGAEIHPAVAPHPGEPLVVKHHPSAFRGTDLLERLGRAGIDTLLVSGMMTHMCVDTTVRAAADHGFGVLLAQDACATRPLAFDGLSVPAQQVQAAYLAALQGRFAQVMQAARIAERLARRAMPQAA